MSKYLVWQLFQLFNYFCCSRAKLLLRKKRYQEQLLLKTDGQLENLEKMTHDLEFAQIELQVVEGLKNGNEALKKVHAALDIAEIEKIMDETREGAEKQEEINALLSGALTEEDEAAVEAELDEIIHQQLPDVPTAKEDEIGEPTLPEVPTTPLEGTYICNCSLKLSLKSIIEFFRLHLDARSVCANLLH